MVFPINVVRGDHIHGNFFDIISEDCGSLQDTSTEPPFRKKKWWPGIVDDAGPSSSSEQTVVISIFEPAADHCPWLSDRDHQMPQPEMVPCTVRVAEGVRRSVRCSVLLSSPGESDMRKVLMSSWQSNRDTLRT